MAKASGRSRRDRRDSNRRFTGAGAFVGGEARALCWFRASATLEHFELQRRSQAPRGLSRRDVSVGGATA